jgi:GMP synthase (glutamine-hydrolysing)
VKPALVLQHVPYEGQGRIADYLRDHGLTFEVLRLWQSYTVPDLSEYSALIVIGGPMGVYEDFPSRNDEVTLIRAAIGRIPTLGICLGSQLIAHALGARVYPNEKDGKPAKEIGFDRVRLTPEGSANPLFKGFPSEFSVLQWHGDAFDLPAGASLLATSTACRNQVFAFENAYGILFHLELTPEMVQGLAEANRAWTHDNFDLDEGRLARDARDLEPLLREQCYRLLDNFFSA